MGLLSLSSLTPYRVAAKTCADADLEEVRKVHAGFVAAIVQSRWPSVFRLLSDHEFDASIATLAQRSYVDGLRAAVASGIQLRGERIVQARFTQLPKFCVTEVDVESSFIHPLHKDGNYSERHMRLVISDGENWRVSIASCPPEVIFQSLRAKALGLGYTS